ncbi:MAG TPA: bacillithiol biosynthesis cysteine-adding enzyme BshC [Flavobacterium sp.]|uniref:bacillithiol biosynthesis cysteine-adding enzyme BshC n=1 Tax=Flavobacterium sp. TaxID=239 RepID=UPI002BD6C572|nr:bacillithiol biosynthesis cysteine-adding enzyme BshC [Flavobacterium sp.]HNP32387.1 bacillithiol biosynthesis cysteine-adding enzyme BshC [Flavobacterium sp.]
MPTDCISYQKSGYFTKLIVDYLEEKPELKSLYNRFPKLENFKNQIEEKAQNYSWENRKVLVTALENQYQSFEISEATKTNISLLADSKTFTITTGHQLNLFTGPLYFLYKIVSTINLCTTLKEEYPQYNFIPVYWMATEDHDFEEINYFQFKNSKIKWTLDSHGPVGRLSTKGLKDVFDVFSNALGIGTNANHLKELFKNSYLKHDNLADATRFLANQLFGDKGLVILDGDDVSLKRLFIPFAKEELINQTSFQKVTETNSLLKKDYEIQVNPREINLFYIEDNFRERIVFEDNLFKINNTKLTFSKEEILALLENNPEKFSPNVIMRPLYEEVILPNLCYIGGGGELSYWLQLKSNFEANKITFPILLLRNSVLLVTEKQTHKADKLHLSWSDLFNNQQELFNNKTQEFSKFNIDFTEQKEHLKQQFEKLTAIANQTDKSFIGAVNAQQTKQIKGLENLEKRLLKAEKRVYAEKLERIIELQNELFPNQGLQERKLNFSEFYLESNDTLIEKLLQRLNPLESNFIIITI